MDIAQPRWSEMPDFVLDMLRVYLGFDDATDPLALQARQARERDALLRDCRQRLTRPWRRWTFTRLVQVSRRGLAQRENTKNEGVRLIALLRRSALEVGRRLTERHRLRQPRDVFFLRLDELGPALRGEPHLDLPALVSSRQAEDARLRLLEPPPVVVGTYDPHAPPPTAPSTSARTLHGVAVSPGVATGRARVILQSGIDERLQPGEILVAPYTDPGWTPYFLAAAAVVVDVGGLLSHGSVVAREFGLPAVVNVGPATRTLRTGQTLRVDGDRGTVTLLD